MEKIPVFFNIIAAAIVIWTIPWKIYAVWLSAKHNKKAWFVVIGASQYH